MRWCRQRVQEIEGETLRTESSSFRMTAVRRMKKKSYRTKHMQPEGCKMGTKEWKIILKSYKRGTDPQLHQGDVKWLQRDAGGDPGGGLEADLLWRSLKEAPERNARPGTLYRGITMITRHNIMKWSKNYHCGIPNRSRWMQREHTGRLIYKLLWFQTNSHKGMQNDYSRMWKENKMTNHYKEIHLQTHKVSLAT